jgi:hypothetical protein
LNADASCSTYVSFGAYYSQLVGMSTYQSLRANFWVLDQGDPTVGLGVDNGNAIEAYGWITSKSGDDYILGGWAFSANYDGCPNDLPNGGTSSSMVVSLSDVNGAGSMTYAVICATRNTHAGVQYSMDFPPGCSGNFCAPFNMVVAPRATITNVIRDNGTNDVKVTVASPSFAAGFYSDGSPNCTAANAIPLYDVYKQQTARDAPPNPSIDAGPWVLTATCNIGQPCTLPAITSPTNIDIYLAVSPHYNSNFTTGEAATGAPARVGPKSTRLQAGPILAVTPKRKTIPNPTGEAPSPQDQ